MEVEVPLAALENLVSHARRIPLTDQVRLNPTELRTVVEHIRGAARTDFGLLPGGDPSIAAVTHLIGDVEVIVRAAQPVPLTRDVRLDRTSVLDLLGELRGALPAAAAARGTPFEPRGAPRSTPSPSSRTYFTVPGASRSPTTSESKVASSPTG